MSIVTEPSRPEPSPPLKAGLAELDDFLMMVERYQRPVASVVARFLDDPRDVEEAVQDTFVQAWRNRDAFRAEAAVFTWLYRIATNTALMRLRRRSHPTVSLDLPPAAGEPALADDPLADEAERLTRISDVRAALAELPEQQRLVVILRDVDGYGNNEVADLLGLPVTTVKALLHRGRTRLRRRLHP
ncbi:MAG: sigma-70 family RNA polymerase sigma factor [Acidimicrobiales bacterium]